MEPFIPFMLFILYPGDGGVELTRHPVVYPDEQACLAAGTDLMLAHYGIADAPTVRCLPMPGEDEFDAMMQRIEAEHIARREAREAERARPEPRPKP